jgi:hypothetical protein
LYINPGNTEALNSRPYTRGDCFTFVKDGTTVTARFRGFEHARDAGTYFDNKTKEYKPITNINLFYVTLKDGIEVIEMMNSLTTDPSILNSIEKLSSCPAELTPPNSIGRGASEPARETLSQRTGGPNLPSIKNGKFQFPREGGPNLPSRPPLYPRGGRRTRHKRNSMKRRNGTRTRR